MPYEDSDSGASTIDQRKYDEAIRPFYEFWKILGNYHNTPEGYNKRPTEDEVHEARKRFLNGLDEGWREIYNSIGETQNYLKDFTRGHYMVLMVLAAEWRLDWNKEIEPSIFEKSLHYDGAALELEPEYEKLLEGSHKKRKEYCVSRIANTHNQAQTSGQ